MIATKEQERKALEQIRKIVEGLGEGSYVGMAFEGCFDDAEENIENDFGCSMKQRWESAKKDAEYFHQAANQQAGEVMKLEQAKDAADKETEKYRKLFEEVSAERDRVLELASERMTQIDGLTGTLHNRDMEILVRSRSESES